MEVKIIKPEESKWKFPCKGISKTDNMIIGFSSYGTGAVLDIGRSKYYRINDISYNWNMHNFQPIEEEKEEEKQPIDWDKIKLPVWAKDIRGEIIVVNGFNGNICKKRQYNKSRKINRSSYKKIFESFKR